MFAILIERKLPAAELAHPNHFIYTLWGSWLYNLSGWMGLPIRALYLMQAANCVLAGLAVILLYRCLRSAGWSSEHGLIAALTFGFSAERWKFATDVDAYIPAIFLLLCVYLLLGHPRMTLLAGFTQAAAILFHELAILFLPVALLVLWKRRSLMTGITQITAYCLAALAPVAIAYVWAYRSVFPGGKTGGLFRWIATRSPGSVFYFNPFSDAGYTLRGTLRLFFGGRIGRFGAQSAIRRSLCASCLRRYRIFVLCLARDASAISVTAGLHCFCGPACVWCSFSSGCRRIRFTVCSIWRP